MDSAGEPDGNVAQFTHIVVNQPCAFESLFLAKGSESRMNYEGGKTFS